MEQYCIGSFSEYISHVQIHYNRNHAFRGQNSLDYRLIPKIGRSEYVSKCLSISADSTEMMNHLQDLEERTMNDFIKMSVPYMDLRNMSPWDQWTIGQHHGLPTRFLDWTENPLIAAYFATDNAYSDVAVYVIDKTQINQQAEDEMEDVFSLSDDDEVVLYLPSYINARIIAQKGIFTVHKDPTKPLDETIINGSPCKIDQLVIPKEKVKEFVNDLNWFGINRSFIYPGLDGLAYHLDLAAKGGVS